MLRSKNVDCEAQLVAENIARQLEERVSFRRAMKQAISRAMKQGAKGIKTMTSGRLGGLRLPELNNIMRYNSFAYTTRRY